MAQLGELGVREPILHCSKSGSVPFLVSPQVFRLEDNCRRLAAKSAGGRNAANTTRQR